MRSIAIQVVREPENGHDILKLNYVQMRESGYINHCVTVMLADTKAKTVTNKLPQLTVLCLGLLNCLDESNAIYNQCFSKDQSSFCQ